MTTLSDQAKDLVIELDRAIDHVEDICRVCTYLRPLAPGRMAYVSDRTETAADLLERARDALHALIAAHEQPTDPPF